MPAGLFLHGFTGAPSSWDAVRALLPATLDADIPWLSGHGSPPAALDVPSFTAEVARLSARLPEDAVVAGYSLGGRLALGVALHNPGRVRALVLISASTGITDPAARAERRARDAALRASLLEGGVPAFVERWEREPLFQSQAALAASVRAEERRRRLGHVAEGLAHSLAVTGLAEMPDYFGRLAELRLPVELVCGELDGKFCDIARSVVRQLPQGRFTCVERAGHNLLLERPDAVTSAIRRGLPS